MAVFSRIFGSRNQRIIGRYNKVAKRISALEDELKSLSDERLTERSQSLRERHDKGETLDDLLVEAFALVREAANRTLGMRHYDVQHIGAMVLHNGDISEMRTGEGKTLMATSAAYLNALDGKGVHIVTVNEYLASRDAEWMRPVYELLGLTVGVVRSGMSTEDKRAAYECDITYATNNELGFDYLRDNLAFRLEDRVQRELSFAIVDEVDSILIDEARTPLIISGPSEQRTDLYVRINKLVPSLTLQEVEEEAPDPMNLRGPVEALSDEERGDFTLDRKAKQVHLTEQGHENAERLMTKSGLIEAGTSLYDPGNIKLLHHLTAALRAHHLYTRDNEYIVQEGEVVIVDEFTGRTMPGRRWSDGLHQAVEAKEGVPIKQENQTLATITLQNFFKQYQKLSGMTGTADTEAFEFQQIYGLEVVVIPTHRPMVRDDRSGVMENIRRDVSANAEELGIEVIDVKIRRADLPETNSEAIFARMETERVQEATQIRAQGREAAQRVRAAADRNATVLRAEAQREADQIRGQGDGQANAIFASAYSADPNFFAFYRALTAYETALQDGDTTIILSPDSEFFRYFNDTGGKR